ncbi:putative GntR family transcriptional regulator [Streptomyces bingchenggensis BCW-1]|uniref:Putative GntR family transcriptional regulator n=1 Tax=Streptomyces bingchenggensis (strain BCW-1) TaxID=749414 RepID=D7BTG9_STRBB|nr:MULTISPECIES: GntR family transcriptional regulator [Streptomyces]ADI07408.1 putative GntR family transcriptional regulator [Streptomyces bingchenggensis BCW-1]
MGEIQRPGALYQQVAAEIRSGIAAGEYKPGSPLPSETQLIERYKVSRPTVRKAIAALRAEGLIEVIHGKGSYVRAIPAPAVTIERTITRTGKTFQTGHHTWEQAETPTVYRTTTTATTGPLLGLDEGEALFGVDRLLTDPKTGTRAMHRVLIPFATAADEAEQLGEAPDTEPEQIYAALTAAGHNLTWQETVSARMPLPDERSTLDIPDATPIVHTARVTLGNDDRPLLLEELRASADRAQLVYRITADRPRQLRAV